MLVGSGGDGYDSTIGGELPYALYAVGSPAVKLAFERLAVKGAANPMPAATSIASKERVIRAIRYGLDGAEHIVESEAENLFELEFMPFRVFYTGSRGVIAHVQIQLCGEVTVDGEVERMFPVTLKV